jgi:predicted nucleic acid-binding protein
MRFWDSSVVVPLLIQQAASRDADQWIQEDNEIALWKLTPAEITSALWRLVRENDLAEEDANTAEARLEQLVDASHIVVDVDGAQTLARRLLRVHNLRAADALQLGAALLWAGGRPHERVLLTLDTRLVSAARREGFNVP